MLRFISVFGALSVLASVASGDKPTVTVYYESLCSDSIAFVTKQLFPNYASSMKNYYNLKMVPYGKSKLVSGSDPTTWKFTCHHGERECYGNKVHGCALERTHDLDASLRFIVCLMKKTLEDRTAPYPVEDCASATNVDSRDIIQCANYTAGNEVLKKYGDETDSFMNPLVSVPTVSFDGKFDKKFQEMAVENFAYAICKRLDHAPQECQHVSGAGTASLGLLSAALLTAPFLL